MPQWNCACANCRDARAGKIPPQTQSSVALSADGGHWFLINASPDIREQIGAFSSLHPHGASFRHSPIEGVLLTNADLDHVAGILFLREGQPLHLHGPTPVREALANTLGFTQLLDSYCGVVWHDAPLNHWQPLTLSGGTPSAFMYQAIPLPSPPPIFGAASARVEESTVAYLIKDERTGGTLLIAPDVFQITPALDAAMKSANAILFDGTFWSEDELANYKDNARTASQMGHLPIHQGSLDLLATCPARHRVYLHINNTNPIYRPGSLERAAVEKAGLQIGHDGMEFEL